MRRGGHQGVRLQAGAVRARRDGVLFGVTDGGLAGPSQDVVGQKVVGDDGYRVSKMVPCWH